MPMDRRHDVARARLVIRDNPATPGLDTNYLQYTGDDHVVLGGTAGNDIIIASDGDDTLYGDGGNDRLEGGYGNDMILGGAGDDIITDIGGDDNIQGGDGNDVIHGGNGINLILGGFGSDFIVTGEDAVGVLRRPGQRLHPRQPGERDSCSATKATTGSRSEWPTALPATISTRSCVDPVVGNDVFFGDSTADRMDGEGGDDIMMGNGGPSRTATKACPVSTGRASSTIRSA